METAAEYLKSMYDFDYSKRVESITVGQFLRIMSKHKYILVRHNDGMLVGINCSIKSILEKRDHPEAQRTQYYSWRVCSFHEYLNYKTPFCRTVIQPINY